MTDFIPGIFSLKMLRYNTETRSSVFSRQYTLAQGITIGRLIDVIRAREMDKFLFELYTHRGAAKGCGHFAYVFYLCSSLRA